MTWAHQTTMFSNAVKLVYDDLIAQKTNSAGSLVGNINVCSNALDNMNSSVMKGAGQAALAAIRDNAKARRALYRSILDPHLASMGQEIASTAIVNGTVNDPKRLFRDIRDYMDDAGLYSGGSTDQKVTAKAVTKAADPADSATGVFRRLTVDCRGQKIESGRDYTTKNLRVTATSAAGSTRRKASLKMLSGTAPADFLEENGAGYEASLDCTTENNPGSLLGSNVLMAKSGSVANTTTVGLTDISGWTGTDEAGSPAVTVDTTSTFLYGDLTYMYKYVGASTTRRWTLNTPSFASLDPYTPVSICWPVYMHASWQGTVSLVVGGTTMLSVAHGAMSAGFNYLTPTMDSALYPMNFAAAANLVTYIQVATGAGASTNPLYARMPFIVPMKRDPKFDSNWYSWFMRAQDTPDLFASVAYADSTSIGGKYQYVLDKVYNQDGEEPEAYLNTTGTNTLADPS